MWTLLLTQKNTKDRTWQEESKISFQNLMLIKINNEKILENTFWPSYKREGRDTGTPKINPKPYLILAYKGSMCQNIKRISSPHQKKSCSILVSTDRDANDNIAIT